MCLRRQGGEILERELRPEFVNEILAIDKKGEFHKFKSVKELRARVQHHDKEYL